MKKLKKFGTFLAAQYAVAFVSTMAAFAGSDQYIPDGPVSGDLIPFVQDMLNFATTIAALIAVAMLIYSGVMYITANGDEGKIDKATKGITYAVVGLVIAFIATMVVRFVINDVLEAN